MTPALLREVFGLDALIVPEPLDRPPQPRKLPLAGEE